MTLRVQGTISIDGGQAKAEAKAVAGELRKVGADATGMGRASQEAGNGTRALGTASRNTASDLRALAAAERQAAADAISLGRSHSIGAGGVANLTSQFNDIGVMLAAGQNPLQLAIQQGTQITQVFGNMGAGAAVRGLGQALLSMVSPLNLITIGGIAAGAAIVQWLFQAGEEAQSLEDQFDDLASSVDTFAKSAREARAPSEDLVETYGRMASEARAASRAIAESERAQAQSRILGTAQSLSQSFGGFDGPQGDLIGSDYEQTLFRLRSELGLTGREAVDVAQKLQALSAANGPEEVVRAALAARDSLSAAGVAADSQLSTALSRLSVEAAKFVGALADNGKLVELAELVALQADGIRGANVAAEQMIGTLQAEAQIRNQIAVFGRDSEFVAQSRLAIERDLVAAQLEAEGIIGAVADRVLNAWDNAKGFSEETAALANILTRAHDAVVAMVAAAPGGGWLAGAIADADTLASKLWDAAAAAASRMNAERELSQMKFEFSPGGQALGRYGGRGTSATTEITDGRGFVLRDGAWVDPSARRGTGRGGSAGGRGRGSDAAAKEAQRERDAVEELIKTLEREVELERELDPVKRQMIQYREQMSAATQAEREQIEGLIVQREREKAVTESLKFVGEATGDALIDAMMGGVDAGERLIDTLKRAVLQALLLGNGPLAGLFGGGLFGGGGGGGLGGALFGGLFDGGGLFAGLAEGGMVFGEGGPTDDKVPRWLSPGEFVVNARATRRHRHMLEGLNSAPGMATGGFVGQGAAGGAPAGGVTIAPVIDARGANDPAAVEAAARRGMALALEEYRRTGLPNDILRTLDSPNVRRF